LSGAIPRAPQAWPRLQPWLSLLVRLGLAVVMFWAAIPKLSDLRGSTQMVALYQIFPPAINQLIGVGLPIIELTLGILFLTGLLSRYASIVFGLMLVAFIAGIISAWARGLSIDCGCFSVDGALKPGEQTKYGQDILRDIGFMAMTAFLAIWPRSMASADTLLGLNPRTRAERAAALSEFDPDQAHEDGLDDPYEEDFGQEDFDEDHHNEDGHEEGDYDEDDHGEGALHEGDHDGDDYDEDDHDRHGQVEGGDPEGADPTDSKDDPGGGRPDGIGHDGGRKTKD
jgi:uncharacterized membrane protein YphA (DoxX/SURF4 family)